MGQHVLHDLIVERLNLQMNLDQRTQNKVQVVNCVMALLCALAELDAQALQENFPQRLVRHSSIGEAVDKPGYVVLV